MIAAAEEERFTLAMHVRGELPRGAIGFCLKQAGITMRDVGSICSPLKTYTNYAQRLSEYFKYQFGHSPKIELYDHHLCHAASSFYGSGFSEATVACFDFSEESSAVLVAHAHGNDCRVLTRFGRHNSLGLYCGRLTQYIRYQMTNDECKVMGLSSFGSPEYLDRFAKLLRPNGISISYELDPELDSAGATRTSSPAISRRGRSASSPRRWRCYPTGTVPLQFQDRPENYYRRY
ncbi:carbamoyltransferase N-terminal domain-containing protein [Bradyrhizobium diazoefficiens]|uniref:carbamoyltransferase N-terminal domain-containing protein n=1 Tax=Bradyrhizobium diazoefficiens TaxID=1355477 RepID=UPI0027145716|nr:carbamoyltransferase N-terminal domain-containing protein [Bradyrhizobium diazoefficiens]WLA54276.1 carbamoyltransferase N-terminal domain-containing protein [Bradyrhizobium diazoefficiens]